MLAQLPESVLARMPIEVSTARSGGRAGARSTTTDLLERDGYVIVREPVPPADFEALCAGLGTPGFETLVALREDRQTYLCQPGPVPLHTDHPAARYIGWHCLRQDSMDGAMLLVDHHAFFANASGAFLRTLEQVLLPTGWGPDPQGTHPVVTYAPGGLHLFYAPWLRPVAPSQEEGAALEGLCQLVAEAFLAPTVEVRLEPGQVLIIDNHRILHGRRALKAGSPRMLRRLWIRERESQVPENPRP